MGLLELLNKLPWSSLSLNQWGISSTNRWPIFIQLYAVKHTTVLFSLGSVRLVMDCAQQPLSAWALRGHLCQNYLACCYRCRDFFLPSFARPHKTDLSPVNVVVLGFSL